MSIRIAIWLVTAVLALLLFLPGCKPKNELAANEVIEQTYNVDPNATLRIANGRGSVTIHGNDQSEVRMRAVKSAPSAAQLREISVNVTADPGDILIKTAFLRQKKKSFFAGGGAVDYTLFVPRTARIARLELDDGKVSIEGMQNTDVSANVVDGQLAIRSCCGNIKAGVVNGVLDLLCGRCEKQRYSSDVQVLNGNLRLSIVRGASFRVRGETLNGKITNELGETVQLGQPGRKIDVSVGAGLRSDITMRVTSGDITVVAADSE